MKRSLAMAGAVVLISAAGAVALARTASAETVAADCGQLFDDFSYSSSSDSTLTGHGWVPRSYAGGPGVAGATWSPANITFPTADGQKVMQLSSYTDGTAGGTGHAELYSAQKRYFEGTYASRVRFSDTPSSGADGDHINQTFFTISPLAYDMDPTYSELDVSEYLPNGGWGETGPINYQTTWYTYQNDPWVADNVHSEQRNSLAGWHDLVVQVAGGHVKYYIDGALVGDHSGKFYPRQTMTINWNQWFIDLTTHSGGRATYLEQVDYVLHAKNAVLSPAQVTAQITGYRSAGTAFTDSLSECAPSDPPTTPPTDPPTDPPATHCGDAPTWSIAAVYTGGQLVKHERSRNGDPSGPPSGDGVHLWKAKWWTQGSEPGWTKQWADQGRC
jgi:hypothetical protein